MAISKISKTARSKQNEERQRGGGSIYLRGQTYWIRYWRRGEQFRESSGSRDPASARKLLDRRMKEIWADRRGLAAFAPNAEKIYVDALLDDLEKSYMLDGGRGLPQFRAHLKPIREAFGDNRAVDVTTAHVETYIEGRLAERAPATVNRETQLLGQAFSLALQRRQLVNTPFIRHLPERNVREGFFERGEFEAILAKLPEYLRDFARFAYSCAWRKGQIASLTWGDVDRNGGAIQARAKHVKNGRDHRIVLEGELAEIIERCWAAREYKTSSGAPGISQYVFHREGRKVGDFRKAWASACQALGLVKPKLNKKGEPVTEMVDGQEQIVMVHARLFHDTRRSGVRNMVRAGVREGVAMAISGHRTRAVFDRYNITSDDDMRQAVRQTQEHLEGQPAGRKVVAFGKKS